MALELPDPPMKPVDVFLTGLAVILVAILFWLLWTNRPPGIYAFP